MRHDLATAAAMAAALDTVYRSMHTPPARKIVTSFDYPPIPSRDADWSAVLDGYDAGDPIGRGRTEADAVADLLALLEEREEERRS